MVTLFTDIDNTMIYSRRRVTDITNMYLVECYNNQPLSYMTRRSYNTLNKSASSQMVIHTSPSEIWMPCLSFIMIPRFIVISI